ncbi:MAG: class I SAM-dependent methyltransferase [Roseiflexaceae bacterium]
MLQHTITRDEARQIYNRLGSALDRAAHYERQAKQLALRQLDLAAGQRVLHVGVGTGQEHAQIHQAIGGRGVVVGYDLARGMLHLTRQRADTPLCEGDANSLPFSQGVFDRVFSAYMLDLIPLAEIPHILAEFRRVLRPHGRLVLVSLTEGIDPTSRLFVSGWKLRYRMNPAQFGGCRPLQIAPLLTKAGFAAERSVVVQHGFPSEIVIGVPHHQ